MRVMLETILSVCGLAHSCVSSVRSGQQMEAVLGLQRGILSEVKRLSDGILYAPNLLELRDTSGCGQRRVDDLRRVREALDPVQRSLGEEVLASSLILTPEKMRRELGVNPWNCLFDITPLHRARSHYDRGMVPIVFEDGSAFYVGWQMQGTMPQLFDCEYNPGSGLGNPWHRETALGSGTNKISPVRSHARQYSTAFPSTTLLAKIAENDVRQRAGNELVQCPRCLGKGRVESADIDRLDMRVWWIPGSCKFCSGKGRVERHIANTRSLRWYRSPGQIIVLALLAMLTLVVVFWLMTR